MIVGGIHAEVWIASGYALFLALVALALELLARHSHKRSEQIQTAGFQYNNQWDAWDCPEGQRLHRHEVDPSLRVVRYRAHAHICNACRIKLHCTDSDDGRMIERRLDSWLESEIRRFHRGLSLALLLLASLILALEAIHYRALGEQVILVTLLAPMAAAGIRLLKGLSTPV